MTTINTNTTVSQINIATQKAAVEAEYKALVFAIGTELGDVQSFLINKRAFSKAELIAKFQARIDAAERTKADRTGLHASVAAERELQKEVAPLRSGFKQFLQSRYGKNSPEMQKFGFTQAKVPQRAVATKSAAVDKAKATRVARKTQGKKQKINVKGAAPVATGSAGTPPVVNTPAKPGGVAAT
jgi:hypothetical protein